MNEQEIYKKIQTKNGKKGGEATKKKHAKDYYSRIRVFALIKERSKKDVCVGCGVRDLSNHKKGCKVFKAKVDKYIEEYGTKEDWLGMGYRIW